MPHQWIEKDPSAGRQSGQRERQETSEVMRYALGPSARLGKFAVFALLCSPMAHKQSSVAVGMG